MIIVINNNKNINSKLHFAGILSPKEFLCNNIWQSLLKWKVIVGMFELGDFMQHLKCHS